MGLHGILKLLTEIILKFKLDHKLINDINILYQDTFTEHNIIQYFYPNHSFDSIICSQSKHVVCNIAACSDVYTQTVKHTVPTWFVTNSYIKETAWIDLFFLSIFLTC